MTLDLESRALLESLAQEGLPPLHEMSPQDARGLGVKLKELYGDGPQMERVVETEVAAADGEKVRLRWLIPVGSKNGVIVHYHGGGWVLGELDEWDTLCRTIADRTGCAVVLPEYRLAPENRFPTAYDDSWSALVAVDAKRAELDLGDGPLIVSGDSAGGGLAALMGLRARDEGTPEIDAQVLVYPVTDCDLDGPSYLNPDNQLLLSRETMAWFWDHYAPNADDRKGPKASPLRVGDLRGLPPTLIMLAQHDVLRAEGEEYGRSLADAGVDVTLRVFPGQMHGFFGMINVLPGSQAGIRGFLDFVGQRVRENNTAGQGAG